MSQVTWKDEPEEHDFPAASDHLVLLAAPTVDALVQRLRDAPTAHWKATDHSRAARLSACRRAGATGPTTGRRAP